MTSLPHALERLIEGRSHDPFAVLGRFTQPAKWATANGRGIRESHLLRVYLPDARAVQLEHGPPLRQVHRAGLWELTRTTPLPLHPCLIWQPGNGQRARACDAYSFPVCISELDAHLFNEGRHHELWRVLGAHPDTIDGFHGVRFAVWAPNAERVSVVGDFNGWDGRRHAMQAQRSSGLWCLFVPDVAPGDRFKYELRNRASGEVLTKSDPIAQAYELRPATASVVPAPSQHRWNDDAWLAARAAANALSAPLSIYEVHLGSWRRDAAGYFSNYRTLAVALADYLSALSFTHVELMPITEHPFDGSWGYQTLGFFAPTARFGTPDDFRFMVDYLHQRGIGVLLDWVPGHFPKDSHGLARFDGSTLYEHEDPRMAEHPDWKTLEFNYARNEVRAFLTSSALYWLKEMHLDGLRVDAVASMLYLDYSREPGQWLPNADGGRENLDAIAWLKQLNEVAHGECPGTMIIAEESTSYPLVTQPTYAGGLGFSMKWNMGWMHDTLDYLRLDPVHRSHHHRRLTFGMLYAYSENFVLPLSHDEVVHGKSSLLHKMNGDDWQRFANLRLLLSYQWTYPGKKLLFMGGEFAQRSEWNHDSELPWDLLQHAPHQGVQTLVRDLNQLLRAHPSLHERDWRPDGFAWIDCDDHRQSVISYLRMSDAEPLAVVLNFTPIVRYGYRLGLPAGGQWQELLNSDAGCYGGSEVGNQGLVRTQRQPHMNQPYSALLTLPPLAALILTPVR